MQINSKIYYYVKTGEVLVITPESSGDIKKLTKEEEMNNFPQIKDKNIDEIDYIELEYGTLSTKFINCKSRKVNSKTKELEVVYYTQEEIDAMNAKREEEAKTKQALDDSISTISEYLTQNSTNISDIENYILQKEQNKILGVM